MGFLKDILNFPKGNKDEGDPLRSAIFKLKFYGKRLDRQANKLESQVDKTKSKARELRSNGDIAASRQTAKNYLQMKKQVQMVHNFKYKLDNLKFKLEQANAVRDLSNVMGNVASQVSNLKMDLSVGQIGQMLSKISADFGVIEFGGEAISDGIDEMSGETGVSDKEVDKFLGEIDEEIGVQVSDELPTVSDDKIKDLEDQLNDLKSED